MADASARWWILSNTRLVARGRGPLVRPAIHGKTRFHAQCPSIHGLRAPWPPSLEWSFFFNFFFKQPRTSWWMLMKKIYQWMLSPRRYPLIWIFFFFFSFFPFFFFRSYGNDRMMMSTTQFSALVRSVRKQKDSQADLFEFFFDLMAMTEWIMSWRTSPLSKEVFVDKTILMQIHQWYLSRRTVSWFDFDLMAMTKW